MITYVTVIAQQESAFVGRFATTLAHRTVQTAPALFQDHLGNFGHTRAVCVKALAALAARDYSALFAIAKTAATQTHILGGDKC